MDNNDYTAQIQALQLDERNYGFLKQLRDYVDYMILEREESGDTR